MVLLADFAVGLLCVKNLFEFKKGAATRANFKTLNYNNSNLFGI